MIVDVPWNENTGVIKLNPLGKVPVWVTTEGENIFDSRIIVEYLENKNSNKFSSINPDQYLKIKQIESLSEGVMDASLCLFAEKKYLYDNRLTVADFALISALGYIQLRFSDDFKLADKYPRLMEYYNQMMQLESVASTVPVL